jgi:hypothetical protein
MPPSVLTRRLAPIALVMVTALLSSVSTAHAQSVAPSSAPQSPANNPALPPPPPAQSPVVTVGVVVPIVPSAPAQLTLSHVTFESQSDPLDVTLMPLYGISGYMPMAPGACRTPCVLDVPPGTYRMSARNAAGRSVSRTITVTQPVQRMSLRPSRSLGMAIGLTGAGGGLVLVALSFLVVGLEYSAVSALPYGYHPDPTPWYAIGAIGIGLGAALLIPGVMSLRGAKGRVEQLSTWRSRVRPLWGVAPIQGGAISSLALIW